ncbi:hybrid sensor histidine kinase/response regulator transcription factor [uncultured Algibacter sp.]|uniref:hybrid sensor histidine kinase/response regulator transcription factor n=1 Tax=uncultured Algibacter sp. TaxID=298659 RepID=UPI00261D52C3|nr:hybrid sensor histidine kinase/response regulator transcription factor [uncultured Algibacter sp.]
MCIIIFFLCLNLSAQNGIKKFDFVNIKEGKSKVAVTTIIQDHYGFIWLGTAGVGLSKFDGIDYVNYKHSLKDSTSISSSLVYCSYLDKENKLWFGTEEGLNLYNRDLDQFTRIPIYNENTREEENLSIRSISGDNKNNLFIGTYGHGLYKLNLKTLSVVKVLNSSNLANPFISIFDLKCNNEGRVFAGTNIGLLEYDHINQELIYAKINNSVPSLKTPIQSLLIDHKDIWIGTESEGLTCLKYRDLDLVGYKIVRSKITNKRIFAIVKLTDGTILCGTENDGLLHMDTNGNILNTYLYNKEDENSLRSNSIWSLFRDKDNRIWLGYYNSGVSIYDNSYDKFNHIKSIKNNKNSLSNPSVTGITKDKQNNLWICMDGGGVDVYNIIKQKFIHINTKDTSVYSGLTSDYIECMFIDSKNNIWLGSWNDGLFFLPNGSKKFINYNTKNTNGNLASNTILSITEDNEGTIWIGTFYKGLHSFNPQTKKIKRHDSKPFVENNLVEVDVRKVLVDSRQNIWVGTTGGLFKVIKDDANHFYVISYEDEMAKEFNNQITSSHVLTLYESLNKQKIWIGTRGAGFCEYDYNDDTFSWYNNQNGFTGENITGITQSNNNDLWISSNSGLYRCEAETSKFTNFTYNDGLLSNDYNINAAFKDTGGNLYFGNYQGVDYFNPNKIETNKNLPSVYLTDFKLFNQKVFPNIDKGPLKKVISETKEIELTHKQSVFTIEFTAINYTRPEKNQFAYYLDGLENSWNYVGNTRNATYTNLDYGTYTFKLKAANNDGAWNETPISLKITILPPWWKTNWAILGYIILFLLVLFFLRKIGQERLKEKQLIAYERETRKQKEALNEKKFQFFTNISHEFRTPLTLIINPLEDILRNNNLSIPEIVKTKLKTVHKNTDRLHRLINELLDFRKLELDKVRVKASRVNLVQFIKSVVSHFKEEVLAKQIHLIVDTDVLDIPLWADRSMLEKIIFNLLSNAIKITPNGGSINVEVRLKEDKVLMPLVNDLETIEVVEIIISDSGPGIDEEQVNKIFERFYQVENLNNTYYGGTGIGLEVVKNFVHLHKGEIKVNSELGKGTSFKIYLPLGKEHFNKNELAIGIEEIKEIEESFVKQQKIEKNTKKASTNQHEKSTQAHTLLIVEDNLELQAYLKQELKSDYHIHTATNGFEGFEIATKVLPDIILTDVIMPKMDGFEFCKKVKSDIKTSHIPLLMLTAKTRIDNRMEGIELGADAYMVKPFNLRLLKLRLAQLITSRKLIFDKYFSVISELPENTKTTSIDKEFIEKVLNYINDNISDPNLNVEMLAAKMNLSKSQFYRKIKALTNQTANEFLRNIRLQKAKQILEIGSATVGEVSFKVGFSSHSYFTKCFKNYYGILPTSIEVNN